MKKQLFCVLALFSSLSLFIGCEKTADLAQPPVDKTLYDVRLSVSAFSINDEPIGKLSSVDNKRASASVQTFNAVQEYLSLLEYFIYDNTGQLVERISQDKSSDSPSPVPVYGETGLKLPIGEYKIVIVGTLTPLTFGGTQQFSTAYLSPPFQVDDIFFKVADFTVTGQEDVLETINIERIVASLEVNQTESTSDLWGGAPPQVSFETVSRYPFDSTKECVYDGSYLTLVSGEFAPWRTINFISKGYVLPDRSDDFHPNVYINIAGHRFETVADKYFGDITIKPNRKLTLTGTLTGKYQNQHIDLTADSAWIDHQNIEFTPN